MHIGLTLVVLEEILQLINQAGSELSGIDRQPQRTRRGVGQPGGPCDLGLIWLKALGLLHNKLGLTAVFMVERPRTMNDRVRGDGGRALSLDRP